jgi:hypothetical protein
MGSLTAPHFQFCCIVSEATLIARVFSDDAHRKSGVVQLWFGSKPGGVMLPPELDELTSDLLLCRRACKRKDEENSKAHEKGS